MARSSAGFAQNRAMNAPPAAQPPNFTSAEFRAALRTFATGVTVVTAFDASGTPVGVTANSFNSVSLTPPLVLWSLSRQASTMTAFSRGSHYAINILAADQRHVAERFSRRDIDRFDGVPMRTGQHGAPILEGVMATFECFNRSQYEEGDHIIFVGEVERCHHQEGLLPLIFHDGKFYTELPL